jgi:Putative MetA-pathway of phenol degradation
LHEKWSFSAATGCGTLANSIDDVIVSSKDLRAKLASCLGPLALLASTASLADNIPSRQAMDEAWWTGPLLAASASTLPQGHFLVEPYLFDVITYGRHDAQGNRLSVPHENAFGSLSYVLYGVTDRISAGLIPRFGFEKSRQGPSSPGAQVGDLTLQAQYRLTQFQEGGWVPTMSLVVGETLPTGKYDRLDQHPGDGFGAGAYTTILSLYTQDYFWLSSGRILRMRLDLSYSLSSKVALQGVSVYGTGPGFSGHAQPGDSFTGDLSWEYSLTRNWVLALDVVYEHDANTTVTGDSLQASSGNSWSVGFAPAVEYNFNARIGIIAGARFIPIGRNASISVTPVAAVNMVF